MSTTTGMLLILSVVAILVPQLDSSPPCDHYGGPRCNYPFLPAPPGRTPSCAKSGGTFCEKIDHYPMQLIRYLVERWGYDYNTLLSDESRDEFQERTPKPLPPPPSYHYGAPHYGYSKVVPVYYPQSKLQPPAVNYTVPIAAGGGGYPDRRYRFDSRPASTPYYSGPYLTTLLPGHYTPSENWWTRYSREAEKVRTKRQTSPAPGANQLCPVTSSFVMPRAAMNNRGNWMYVVNINEVDDRYTQLVRSETCVSNQCNGLCSIPNGYTSSCTQQYVQKRLIALEGSGDRLYTDVFWFPHCCICQIVPVSG